VEETMLARQIAIGFGIAMIFPLLVYYGVATFNAPPRLQALSGPIRIMPQNATPEERNTYLAERKADADEQQSRRDAYAAAAKIFARTLLIVSTPLGVAAIFAGAFLALHSIGTGLIFGGIETLAFGYWNYWQYLDDWMRFVSLVAGFCILVFVGYQQFSGVRSPSGS
jgi:hypothetical protein